MTLRPLCPECGRISIPDAIVRGLNGSNTVSLKCGHTLIEPVLPRFIDWDKYRSRSGKALLPFQIRSIDFAHGAGLRFVCTHRMGLGKTVIACALLKKYQKQLGRVLISCKANLTTQWMMELFDWSQIMAQRIETSKEPLHHDSFDVFIISQDLLRSVPWIEQEKFNTIIIDEVQNYKNLDAERTKCMKQLTDKADYVWGLSGTPVKNHMGEYYYILHAVRPDLFRKQSNYISDFCEYYNDGYGLKVGGGKNLGRFREITKEFVFGYTREEVMPELPKIRRTFRFLDLDKGTNEAYRRTLARFREAYFASASDTQERFQNKAKQQQEIKNMYQIVGLSKVRPTIDFAEEFLDSEENGDKIVFFVEHIQVGDMLETGINALLVKRGLEPCVRMRGGISADESTRLERLFKDNKSRKILIASTRGCGEGKNFQFCSRAVMVERQWNAANEEQAECRFTRIGSVASFVDITYMVARKTYDEEQAKLIERKREISHKAVGEDVVDWEKSPFMSELLSIIARSE